VTETGRYITTEPEMTVGGKRTEKLRKLQVKSGKNFHLLNGKVREQESKGAQARMSQGETTKGCVTIRLPIPDREGGGEKVRGTEGARTHMQTRGGGGDSG